MSWDFDSYRFDRNNDDDGREIKVSEVLPQRHQHLLESIAQATNDIRQIDRELASLAEETEAGTTEQEE